MEFQEAVARLRIHKTIRKGAIERHHTQTEKKEWKIFFHRSSKQKTKPSEIPIEFLCPVSSALMKDPVIVSSGHTFECACVQACNTLGFTPTLMDGTVPDFSTVIPNLALKSTILEWCRNYSLDPPSDKTTLDFFSAEKLVRAKILESQRQKPKPQKKNEHQDTGAGIDHVVTDLITQTPSTHDSCYYSSPSSSTAEIEAFNPNPKDEEFVRKLKSPLVFEIEEGLISLRNTTRAREDDTKLQLCTSRLLSVLQPLIISRYTNIQVNSVACLVNLSLEKNNKIKIVRSGILPLLIHVLKGGFPEAKEHACGAIFSLALDDRNKTAIGVLGALPPLLHLLQCAESDRTRHDSSLALYHLSLVQSNITKLVKLGSVPILLEMVKSSRMESQVLLILCNLALSPDGRHAMWDSGGVEVLVGLLRRSELKSESTRDICVSVLYGLSHGGLRFKRLARAAGAVDVLMQVEKTGSERANEKARRIFKMMTETRMEKEDVNWEEVLEEDS
ncbi:PREDICTED: U-box domain-containing protein 40-like [Populus euphratica]|uniref:RING-type E3 ubiquitin transferase n=1 Tax=Populus euphratica TaxID=75702 RepID=A0AAJ6TNI9_POPEU|nr:PREDICTED: U-box domain-containing protein 40-like [Populus euphratica]